MFCGAWSGDIHCRIVDSSCGMFTNSFHFSSGSSVHVLNVLSPTSGVVIHRSISRSVCMARSFRDYHLQRWCSSSTTSHAQIIQLPVGINGNLSRCWLSARFHPTFSPQIAPGTRLRQQRSVHCSTSRDIFVITWPVVPLPAGRA